MPVDVEKLEAEIRRSGLIFGMDLSELKVKSADSRTGLRKIVLPWTVTKEFMDDNPDGEAAADMIQNAMAIQVATDLTDLVIDGDETSQDRLYMTMDGLKKKKLDPSHAVLKIHEGTIERLYHFDRQEYNYTWTFYIGLEENIDWTEFNTEVIYQTYDID